MAQGFNKANSWDKMSWTFQSKEIKDRPCVFLSHKREDKDQCRIVAEYLKTAEIDYYLDELDEALQLAAVANNSLLITDSIKKGIRESTHMMVVISEKTYRSEWVPFEVGYGHAMIIDKNANNDVHDNKTRLSILTLRDLSERPLPDYMSTAFIIRGTKTLNDFIAAICGRVEKSMENDNLLKSSTNFTHPLDSVLNWKL